MDSFPPKKSLGQNFLTDQNIARKIVASLTEDVSHIIEIGPGKGILSELLLQKFGNNILFVETDSRMIIYLKEKFPEHSEQFLHRDFLNLGLAELPSGKMSIIGNLPYNISSQIFFKVIDLRNKIHEMVCMVQKEVAQRIVAPPGNKTYGILSVMLQSWFDCEIHFDVSAKVFRPPPKVTSSVIRLKRNDVATLICDESLFKRIVKTAFGQRRKMLRNSLKSTGLRVEKLEEDILMKRPEQLDVRDFINIAKVLS